MPTCLWLCYTYDHLSDARRSARKGHFERHRFFSRYGSPFITIWVAIALTVALLALTTLPKNLIIFGGVALFFIGIYFLQIILQKKQHFNKERWGACLFIGGITLPIAICSQNQDAFFIVIACTLQLTLLAHYNLIFIALFELQHDKADAFYSTPTHVGRTQTKKILVRLRRQGIIILGITALTLLILHPGVSLRYPAALMIFTFYFMWAAYYLFENNTVILQSHQRYRFAVDGVFLLPGAIGLLLHFL